MSKQYLSPNGSPIVGTAEMVFATALIDGINDDGTPDYSGTTTVDWDSQKTTHADGETILYVDEDGAEWEFKDLVPTLDDAGPSDEDLVNQVTDDWIDEVKNRDTVLGFDEWCLHQAESEGYFLTKTLDGEVWARNGDTDDGDTFPTPLDVLVHLKRNET